MEYKTLELNIISAKGIKDVNIFSKMDVYAVVSLAGDPLHPQTATTNVHRDAGTNPTWNFPAKFFISEQMAQQNRLSLEVKIISDRTLGDTVIGTVHVPLKELLDNKSSDDGSFRQVTYQVRKASGKSKGSFNFSYKFCEQVSPSATKAATSEPVMAYPPAAATGSNSASYGMSYPPPQQQYAAQYGYPPPPTYGGYPPASAQPGSGYGYPPHAGYGYPQQPGYGYPQQSGYGYSQTQKPKKNKFGMGLGAGLLGGALGGMLIGDMVSDAATYDAGYDAGFDDAGGFDF